MGGRAVVGSEGRGRLEAAPPSDETRCRGDSRCVDSRPLAALPLATRRCPMPPRGKGVPRGVPAAEDEEAAAEATGVPASPARMAEEDSWPLALSFDTSEPASEGTLTLERSATFSSRSSSPAILVKEELLPSGAWRK